MNRPYEEAFKTTNELVKARLSNTNSGINHATGQNVADYYQEIFDKVLEIAKLVANEEG